MGQGDIENGPSLWDGTGRKVSWHPVSFTLEFTSGVVCGRQALNLKSLDRMLAKSICPHVVSTSRLRGMLASTPAVDPRGVLSKKGSSFSIAA